MATKKTAKTASAREVAGVALESGVEIPEGVRHARSPYTQAMRAMNVGDSFVVPETKASSVRSSLAKEKKSRKDFAYATHKLAGGDVRVWRVAAE